MNIIIYILILLLCVLLYTIYYKYKRINEHLNEHMMTNNISTENKNIHNKLEYNPVQFHNKQKDTESLTPIDKIHIRHNNNIIRTYDFKDSDLGYRGGLPKKFLKTELDVKSIFI
jgi:hypothetical protein